MLRFFVFLSVVLAIYTAMHTLVWWMVLPLFEASPRARSVLRGCMILAIASPFLVFLIERTGVDLLARIASYAAFSWMGLVFLAFSFSVPLAFAELTARALHRVAPNVTEISLRGPLSATIILLLTLALGTYGLFEARSLRVERVSLTSAKRAAADPPLRLALITDLHLGLIHREATSRAVLARLEELDPDALLVAGDFVDARLDELPDLARLWSEYRPPLGKFAVVGNHEIYPGLVQSLDFLGETGFRVLRNEGLALERSLNLVGVDDEHLLARDFDPAPIYAALDASRYTVLMQHRPTVHPSTPGAVDLQVSGHAHRGQIFPFTLLTGLAYPLQCGLHRLDDGLVFYASRGTGTWGPPMRVLAPPEITLFEITAPAARLR